MTLSRDDPANGDFAAERENAAGSSEEALREVDVVEKGVMVVNFEMVDNIVLVDDDRDDEAEKDGVAEGDNELLSNDIPMDVFVEDYWGKEIGHFE